MDSEKLLERKGKNDVEALGGLSLKVTSSHFTGLPDRHNLLPGGYTDWVEYKTTGEEPSPRQKIVHAQLKKLGHNVFIIDTKEKAEEYKTFITNRHYGI